MYSHVSRWVLSRRALSVAKRVGAVTMVLLLVLLLHTGLGYASSAWTKPRMSESVVAAAEGDTVGALLDSLQFRNKGGCGDRCKHKEGGGVWVTSSIVSRGKKTHKPPLTTSLGQVSGPWCRPTSGMLNGNWRGGVQVINFLRVVGPWGPLEVSHACVFCL